MQAWCSIMPTGPIWRLVIAVSRKADKGRGHQGEHVLMGGGDSSGMAALVLRCGSAREEMQPHPGPGHENADPAGPGAHRPRDHLPQWGDWGAGPGGEQLK